MLQAGSSPWGRKESDRPEQLRLSLFTGHGAGWLDCREEGNEEMMSEARGGVNLVVSLMAHAIKKLSAMYTGSPTFDPWFRKIPWRRAWQPTPLFLPGEFHGQKSLAGCSPWGRKEWNTAEVTHTYIVLILCICI